MCAWEPTQEKRLARVGGCDRYWFVDSKLGGSAHWYYDWSKARARKHALELHAGALNHAEADRTFDLLARDGEVLFSDYIEWYTSYLHGHDEMSMS